ncbi:MAG: hypothetical protein K6F75_00195 [Butyrivibrio sp.]|nr:hypothetical protein [Butyrivibrio sp.]
MKKILALMMAGVLFVISPVGVLATDGTTTGSSTGSSEGSSTSGTPTGSSSSSAKDIVDWLYEKVREAEKQLDTKVAELTAKEEELDAKKAELAEKEAELASQGEKISGLEGDVATKTEEINELKNDVISLQEEVNTKQDEILELKDDISSQKDTITGLNEQVKKQAAEIAVLQNAIKASGGGSKSGSSQSSPPPRSNGRAPSGPSSTDTRTQALIRNNAVSYGGNIVAQGGHVEINGGRSNATFLVGAPDGGTMNSAYSLAASVQGSLINCVIVSSAVAFRTAKVNFYITGVNIGDNIAVYQIQGGKWVQLQTAEIRKDHVVVNMSQTGVVAFVRVPVLATATH